LTYTVTTKPTQGSVTVDLAGAYTYTPNAAAATQSVDTFTVTASDGLAATNETVTVPVGSAGGSLVHGIVALRMVAVTEPVIDISVNGGPTVPVLVDTGSAGLVIGAPYVGQQNLGAATGSGVSGYSGGLTYSYNTYTATVNFGNGIVTAPTSVDVVSAASQQAFANYFAGAGVVGVLGIGPNSGGPGPSIVIAALPGELGDGVLIDEDQGVFEFGPNPLPTRTSIAGAPYASLEVKVGNGPLQPVTAVIDSGGVYGTIPSSVIGGSQLSGNLPAGTVISVYTGDGQTLLYSYTTTGTNTPTVTSENVMDTGYVPFAQGPVYISYRDSSSGTTIFDV
jgi:VCBS repeat-containing protein